MLEGERLAFRYDPCCPWVLRDFSITVAPGEIVGLSGPSGQGKTTLAKILAGYMRPVEGQVRVDGQPLPQHGYCPVQLIFQHPELAINPRWRMAQVLNEGYAPSPDLLAALNIETNWLTRWPHELSGGELQRFAVARALGPQTRYLIADEMTTMLDASTQAQIWHVVLDHARRYRVGVLAISHEQPLLARICDRLLTLDAENRSPESQAIAP